MRSLALALGIVPCLVVIASAQVEAPRIVSPDDKQRAAEHFERGRSAYNFGNYDDAIREYQAAFDLTGAPEFVFNIAQTYRTKGDKRLALDFYKKYVELDSSGAGVSSARSHIAVIEAELRAEEAEAALRRKAEEEAVLRRKAEVEVERLAAAETARRAAAEAAQRRVAEANAARHRTTSRYLRIAGLAAGSAGVATLGVSGFFGFRARTLSHEASAVTGTWTAEAQGKVDRAESAERTMFILLGVGGAVAVASGVLYLVGARRTETAPPATSRQLTAAPVPGGAMVFAGGSF